MSLEQVHEFWQDPRECASVSQGMKAICAPEFFLGFLGIADVHAGSRMLVREVRRYLPDWNSPILELGCNVGRNLQYLFSNGYRDIRGVEISKRAVLIGASYYPNLEGMIEVQSIEDFLTSNTRTYDLVFTMSVLMHIHPDSEWVFEKMSEIAGKLLIIGEVEMTAGPFKYPRNYKKIFTALGWKQRRTFIMKPVSPFTRMRVFERR